MLLRAILATLAVAVFLKRVELVVWPHRAFWQTVCAVLTWEIFVWVTWRVLIWPKYLSPLRRLPQPSGGSFLMGHYKKIIQQPTGAPMREWMMDVPNDGLIRYTSVFNAERLLVTSPKALNEVMTHKSYEFVKPPMLIQGLQMVLGNGILFAEGDEHKRQRKNLSPAFSFRAVKNLSPVFWMVAKSMIRSIDKTVVLPQEHLEKDSYSVEVQDWVSRATLDVIGVASWGQSFHALDEPDHLLYRTYRSVFQPPKWRRLIALLGFLVPFWILRRLQFKRNLQMTRSVEIIKDTCRRMITQKKTEKTSHFDTSADIISTALRSGSFSDEDLVNQMMTFLAAGHETTSSAMQWAIYELCKHQDIQRRLRDELHTAVKEGKLPDIRDPDGTISSEDIERLPYLAAFCQEVLRIWPPVPMTMRLASCDSSLLNVHVPKGTMVVIAPAAINTLPELWGTDAGTFNPDRWMAEGKANTGGASAAPAFLTFLSGPRSCIGQSFARAEFAVLLAAWVMSFETTLEDETGNVEIQGGITIRPKGGLRCKIKKIGPQKV